MGAVAGAAAGGFAGHQANHGFLGGVGGAIAGSMLEDEYKKHNKGKKQKAGTKDERRARREQRRRRRQVRGGRRGSDSSSSSSSSSSSDSSDSDRRRRRHGKPSGNFRASSRHVRLEGHCTLVAECADAGGNHHRSSLDLNDCLTNRNGQLRWRRGGNFAASSRHFRLVDDENVLECECAEANGDWVHNRMDLNQRISNNDGHLIML